MEKIYKKSNIMCVVIFLMSNCFYVQAMQKTSQEVAILYSGGLDSSALVGWYATKRYDVIHLLTFDNGAQKNINLSKIKIHQFKKLFPKTIFHHHILSSSYLFKKIALHDIEDDIPRYKTNLICVGCKMSMHAHALLYAIEHNIKLVADGFAKRQEHFPEQDHVFHEIMQQIYLSYGVCYESPLYDIATDKATVKDLLSRYGISTKSIEPECLFGDTFSKAETESIQNYFFAKVGIMCEFIETFLNEREISLPKPL
jgi:7-cyano-7-deazaguanine synthase in queuosine biosynthesis